MGRRRRPPPPPDYSSLIPIQEQSNLNQFNRLLEAQRADAYTPFGSQTWARSPEGRWTFEQRLSPEQQRLYDQDLRIREAQGGIAEGMLDRVRQEYGSSANFASLLPEYRSIEGPQVSSTNFVSLLPEYRGIDGPRVSSTNFASLLPEYRSVEGPRVRGQVSGPGQFQGLDGELQYSGGPFDRARAEDAIYNRQMRFLEPRLQQDESRLHQRLVSQGFDTRGDAYGEQMRRLQEAQAAMRADAADRAILGGGQEATAELARILEARQRAQAERQADFANQLAASQFDLAADQQRFGQEATAAQFGQSEEQRRFRQGATAAQLGLAADQQRFGQEAAAAQFGQSEEQRRFGQKAAAAQLGLAADQQRFGQEVAAAQFGQNEEKRRLAAALAGIGVHEQDRARLLNEMNAFRTGNQIQLPNVSPTFQTPHLQGIDHLGLATQQYQNQLAQYNAAQAGRSNLLGGLMGLGGAILGGPAGVPIITGIGRRTGWW